MSPEPHVSTLRLATIGTMARVVAILLAIANLVLVSRVLGPGGRGEYVLILTALTVLTVVCDPGLSTAAQSLAARPEDDPADLHVLLAVAVLPATAVALVLAVLAAAVGARQLFGAVDEGSLLIATAVVPLAIYARFWLGLMIGLRRIADIARAQLTFAAILLGLDAVVLIGLGGGVRGAVVAYVLATAVQVAYMLWRAPRGARRAGAPGRISRVLGFGMRSYPLGIASLSWSAVPPFALQLASGPVAVGLFSVAQQLAERALLPFLALQDTAFARLGAATRAEAIAVTQRYTRLAFGAGVAGAAITAAVAPVLVPLLFGESFRGVVAPLQILLLAVPAVVVALLITPYMLSSARRPELVSIIAWAQLAILVAVATWFGRSLDVRSMAVAGSLGQVIAVVVMVGLFVRLTGTESRAALVLRRADVDSTVAEVRAFRRRDRI